MYSERTKIDEIIKVAGHSVLRFPPYLCEDITIELATTNCCKSGIKRGTVLHPAE